MSRHVRLAMTAALVAVLFTLFFPVHRVMDCTYDGDAGSCSDGGVSLVGLHIPLGWAIPALLMSVLWVVAWRLDHKQTAQRQKELP
jgi:hypothetical protein